MRLRKALLPCGSPRCQRRHAETARLHRCLLGTCWLTAHLEEVFMFKPIALRCARVLAAALATCSLPAVAAVPAAEFTVLAALFINNNGSN